MSQIILFKCRACDGEISFLPSDTAQVLCPNCRTPVPVQVGRSLLDRGIVETCIGCGHDTLYIQKDFNRTLGAAIVVVGSLVSLFFFSKSEPVYAMLALVAMAIIDLLVYALVGEVTVCYACHAVYRGFEKNPDHETFDLKNLEKYGGRDPRF